MEEQQLTKKQRRALRRQEREEKSLEQVKNQRNKKIVLWIAGIVVVSAVVFGISRTASDNGEEGKQNSEQSNPLTVSSDDWIKGNRDASVTLIEYSDFQCPACGAFFPIVKQIGDEFGDRIRIVYRHFPLSRIHANAEPAARAAEAAGRQEKFWEMHDILFIRQKEWSRSRNEEDLFAGYADEIGLDKDQFLTDFDAREVKHKISQHQSGGNRLGVQGTPWFFLNGEHIQPRSYEDFVSLIKPLINDEVKNEEDASATTTAELEEDLIPAQ